MVSFDELYIIKRTGKRVVFSVDKIKNAVQKAFLSVGGLPPGKYLPTFSLV